MITFTVRLDPGEGGDHLLWGTGEAYGLGVRCALRLVQEGASDAEVERELRERLESAWSRRWLRSMIVDAKAIRASRIELARTEIVGMPERIARLERRLLKAKRKQNGQAKGLARRRDRLATRMAELHAIADGNVEPSITFGSKKLLRERTRIEVAVEVADWQRRWRERRDGSFFCQGDRDRPAGNAALQLDLGTDTLRVRSPFGEARYRLRGIDYARGRLERCFVQEGSWGKKGSLVVSPVSVRVYYRPEKQAWYAAFTVTEPAPTRISDRRNGALGIDINPDHLALSLVDGEGNPRAWRRINLDLTGSAAQNADQIGRAVKEAVALACEHRVPIVVERLDFGKARTNLRYLPPRLARLLSSFAYRKILSTIQSAASRAGIEFIEVSPAWSSVLGQANHAVPYGVSVDQAAACVIARRGLGFRERPRPSLPLPAPEDASRANRKPRSEHVRRKANQAQLRALAKALPKRRTTWDTAWLGRRGSTWRPSAPVPAGASDSALCEVARQDRRVKAHSPRGIVTTPASTGNHTRVLVTADGRLADPGQHQQ